MHVQYGEHLRSPVNPYAAVKVGHLLACMLLRRLPGR
jgi:hypothetical protein